MPGAILSPIEPSGSPDLNAKARLQPNHRNLAAAAAGLSAESGSSDSCGACIGTPRALSTAGQVPFQAKGAAVSAVLRPNADVSGLERETPPPLSQHSEPQHAHAQARGSAQWYGNSNGALPGIEPEIDMDRDELQRNSMRAAAAAAGGTGGAGPAAHVISGPMLQQLLAVRGMMCGPDGREAGGGDFGGAATDQPDGGNGAAAAAGVGGGGRPRVGGGGLGPGNNPSPGMPLLHTHPKIEQYGNGGGGYGMSMAAQGAIAAAADGGSEGSDFGARRPGNGKRFPSADPDDSPRERGEPRAVGEAPPPGYELPPRAGVGGAAAPSAPSLLALQQHALYSSGVNGGGGGAKAAAGVRGALTPAPRRGSAAAVEAEGYDALGGGVDADDAADFAADGGGAGGAMLPAELPGPVEVTVAVRVGSGRAAEEDARYGNGSYVKGHTCGVFEPALYMSRMDCIRYQGTLISRSHFEKIGGSNMAKWYRSIRVLPDLEPLGEWLERHGMPVTKGPARRYRPRKQPGGATAGGGGGGGGSQPALSNEAGGEASGGGGPGGGEMEVAAPPAAKNRGGVSGEVCSSTCGGGAGAGAAQRQQQQQQLPAVGSSGFALQQHLQQQYLQQQLLLLSGAQGAAAAAAAARLQQAGEASLGVSQGVKLELGNGGGGPARMEPAAVPAVAAGAPSEDEAEGTAALMSLSMQGASGPAAAAPRPPRGGGGGGAAAATDAGTHSPQLQQQRRQQQQQQPPKTARYHGGGGGGTTPEYGGEGKEGDAEGLDRAAADAEVGGGGGGGGDAAAHRRQNGVPRNGSTAAARGGGGGGGPAPGDGSSSRAAAPPSRSEGALGAKDLAAAMAADAAAARAEASALAAPPPAPHVTLNGASATRRGAPVGKLDPEDGSEAMEHVDRGDPRFAPAAGGYGAEDDVHGDADAYGNYPAAAATMRQRAAAAVRSMAADAGWAGGLASGRANGGGGARPLGAGQEIGLPLGQAGYVVAGFPGSAAAVARSGLRGLPPPHLTHATAPGRGRGVSVDAAGGAGAWFGGDGGGGGGGVDAASGGGEYGDEDFDAEDEQLQTHLMSVGAPALLLTIQLEQMELYDRLRRLERLRRRLEALQQQQQQQRVGLPKMEAAVGRRGGPPPGYDALLQHSAAAAAAALDERIGGGGGRGVGVKRPRGDGGGVPGGGGGGGLRMMDEDMYGGGHGADHGMHDSGDAGVGARNGLDVSRLAEMYAAAAAAAASDAGVHLGRGQAPPQPPLVRLVHRGPQPGARGGGGDARELALAAEDDEAYGMYASEVLAPPHAVHRQQQQQQQQAWGRVPRAEAAALQGWGRSHPTGGGGGGNGGGNGGPHRDELRVAAAAAHYAMQLGGAARGGGGGGGRRQRGDQLGIGGGAAAAAPRGVDDDWD